LPFRAPLDRQALVELQSGQPKLGKHTTGKGCLYIRYLEDVDLKVIEKMVARAVSELKRR
jgi:hypothetical protein